MDQGDGSSMFGDMSAQNKTNDDISIEEKHPWEVMNETLAAQQQ